jgi:hypothetical protein
LWEKIVPMSTDDSAQGAPGRNLALATIAFALCFAAWSMLAPLAPKLQDKLGLSDTETAVMIAIPVVLGSLLRIPLGWLVDRVGGRVVFTAMLAYSAGAALLIGFATSYLALLGAGFLLGVAGASFAIGIPFIADWFPPKRQGFALGVYGTGNIGTAIAAFSVPFLYTQFGQASAGIVFGIAIAAFTLLWASSARNAPVVRHSRPSYREVLRSGWPLWQLAFFYFVTFGGFVAMAIFLPKLLVYWFDFSLTSAGLRAAGFTILATMARPVGGLALRPPQALDRADRRLRRNRPRRGWPLLAGDRSCDRPGDDLLPHHGLVSGDGQRRGLQAGPVPLPPLDRRRDGNRRRRRRPRRLLPAARPRHRQGRDRRVHDGLRLPRRLRLDVRGAGAFDPRDPILGRAGRADRRPELATA